MATRRMFSKEIFQSSVMVRLGYDNGEFGLEAQRVFETLILMADDYGRGKFIPEKVRGQAFLSVPDVFSKVTPEMIVDWVKQIEGEGAIQLYDSDGEKYYALTGWNRYQRGDWQRGNSELPDPPLLATVKTKGKGKSKVKDKSKQEKYKTVKPDLPDWCYALIRELFPEFETLISDGSYGLLYTAPEAYEQANTLDKLNRIDNYSQEDIEAILTWAKADTGSGDWPGWSAQFLSCAPLRKKRDGVTKFAKMKAAYEASKVKRPSRKLI